MAADDPPHDRVEAEPVGIVHVVVAAKASENGLAELANHAMPPVHAGTTVGKNIANHLSKFNGGIKLSIGEQTGVSSDLGPVELKLESTVKIDPKAQPSSAHQPRWRSFAPPLGRIFNRR